jgi:LEA14-like dessication related protein
MSRYVFLIFFFSLFSCVPKDPVVFRSVNNVFVDVGSGGSPLLKGDAVFFNPNKTRMKLKEINLEIFVNGKSAAKADQKLDITAPPNSTFSVPLEVRLSLKDQGLLDTVFSLLGGKKYEVQYHGFIRVKVHGVTVKIPVDYKDEVKLKF